MTLSRYQLPSFIAARLKAGKPVRDLPESLAVGIFSTTAERLVWAVENDEPVGLLAYSEHESRWRLSEISAEGASHALIELCREIACSRYWNAMSGAEQEPNLISRSAQQYMIEKVYRDACDITSALYEATTVVPELFGEEAAARALDDFDIRYGALMRHLAARSKTARDYA